MRTYPCLALIVLLAAGCHSRESQPASSAPAVPARASDPRADAKPLPAGLSVSMEAAPAGYTVGEPMLVTLRVRNNGKDVVTFGVEVDGVPAHQAHALTLSVTDPEAHEYADLRAPQHGGVFSVRRVSLAPGEEHVLPLALAEWHPFAIPGRYDVAWAYAVALPGLGGTLGTAHGTLVLNVRPRDEVRIRQVCRTLADQAILAKRPEEPLAAAVGLSYCRDDAAVPFLQEVIAKAPGGQHQAIEGLLRIASPDALRALEKIAAGRSSSASATRYALRGLRTGEHRVSLPMD